MKSIWGSSLRDAKLFVLVDIFFTSLCVEFEFKLELVFSALLLSQ